MQRLAELITGWLSFAIIGSTTLTLSVQSLIAFRWMNARHLKGRVVELESANQQLTEQNTTLFEQKKQFELQLAPSKPTIEILSPFNAEEVGLYETVRGRVMDLQVLVYAPDNKWYTQKQVNVKEGFWHVKCQFGQLEGRGGDSFKIVAVAGNGLAEGMWYDNLPDGIRSKTIQVHRQESPVEQRLYIALNDLKNAKLEANQEKGTKDSIYELYRESESKLASLAWLSKMAEEQAKTLSAYVMASILTIPHSGELVLEGRDLSVIVGVKIRNESVFTINITDNGMSGSFAMNGKTFKEPAGILKDDFRGPILSLAPLKAEVLILEQPLRQSEAETIARSLADTNAKIWIGGLSVMISTQDQSIPVTPSKLNLSIQEGNIPLSQFKCNTISADS